MLSSPARVRGWALWSLPRPAVAFLLAVESLTVLAAVGLTAVQPLSGAVAVRLGLLAVLALGFAEVGRRVERIRTYLAVGEDQPLVTPLSVWSFAAVVIAPAGWAAALLVVLYVQQYAHSHRDRSQLPHRLLFSAAAAVAAQLAAAAVAGLGRGHGDTSFVGALLLAAAVYTAVNLLILVTGMWLAMGRPSPRGLLPSADSLGHDQSCLALGLAAGLLLVYVPIAVPVLLGPVLYLQRSTMVTGLRSATRTDAKTGVLHSAAWREHAGRLLESCRRERQPVAVFILDIDHFKSVNDRHGHLVGDLVLTEVSRALRREIRAADAIGRFGGDEFVLILDGPAAVAASEIGERVQGAIREIDVDGIHVDVSIGLACAAADRLPLTLDELIGAADIALYDAKLAGRGRVSVSAV